MTRRSGSGTSPERLGIGRRDRIFSPALAVRSRLRVRGRRSGLHRLRIGCACMGPGCMTECPFNPLEDRQGEGPQSDRALVDARGRGAVVGRLPTLAPGDHRVRTPHGHATRGDPEPALVPGGSDAPHAHDPRAKNGSRDTLPVNDTAMAVLQARAAVRTSSTEAVFMNGAGHARNARNLLRAFYPAMRKADITRFRFHDLRHTFATRLIQAGVDVYTVQKLGRWKTISMVLRYAHHQPESLRAGAEVLDRLRREMSTTRAQSGTTMCVGVA